MPEKLLTIEEVSSLLGVTEERLRGLVEKGELPAYKIGGKFLRFRKEQVEAIMAEISAKPAGDAAKITPKKHLKTRPGSVPQESLGDRISDFFYFKDFYIIAIIVSMLILWFIFT